MNLLHEIITSPWFIEAQYANDHFPMLVRLMRGDPFVSPYADDAERLGDQSKIAFLNNSVPFTVDAFDIYKHADKITEPSLYILDIKGPITKYDTFCGPDGMLSKAYWIQKADMHPNVFGHVINIDSGGGSGYAARYMGEVLSKLKKPVFAFIEDFAASAAYWIASAANANHITISSKMAMAGSIGTYMTLRDYSKMLKKTGIAEVDVYASKSTAKNIEYRLMQIGKYDEAAKIAQVKADQFNDFFHNQVIGSRGSKLKSDAWNTGEMFFAQDAVDIGLVDDVLPWEEFLQAVFDEFAPSN